MQREARGRGVVLYGGVERGKENLKGGASLDLLHDAWRANANGIDTKNKKRNELTFGERS